MSDATHHKAAITPQKANKRPAPSSGTEQPRKRPVKRRASKACASCRARKVRCNVVEHGAPCTNCRLDQVECVIAESRRKRKPTCDRISGIHSPTLQDSPLDGQANEAQQSQTNNRSQRRQSNASHTSGHMPHSLYRNHGTRPNHIINNPRRSFSSMSSDQMSPSMDYVNLWPLAYRNTLSQRLISPPLSTTTLPDNIKPLPPNIDSEASDFLYNRGALTLPSTELRNAILTSFAEYVDPFMPVLNLAEFLQMLEHEDGSYGRVSLQLFQAVMFAGSAFVDLSYLRKAGFSSRREAHKNFFHRARLLHDFDYEKDRVTLVQAVLLMTYWWDSPDDSKDTWHWMGIAISMAQSIGLNNDPSKSHLDAPRQRQWKRIWWSCVIRDRLISIGMRRTMRIKTVDHNVPLPKLEDFELQCLPSNLLWIPAQCNVAHDLSTRKLLAHMFIEKSRLSICIGNVMSQYSAPEQRIDEEGKAKLSGLSMPKKSLDSSEVRSCHDELQNWLFHLPDSLKASGSGLNSAGQEYAPVVLHRALLHLVFYMTLATLHRTLPVVDARYPTFGGGTFESPRYFVRNAAYRITDIAHSLLEQGYQQYLPTTGVTVLQPALISLLVDMKSPRSDTRREALRGFCRCVHVLSKLRDCYSAADFTMIMVETSIQKADIDVSDWMQPGRSGLDSAARGDPPLKAKRIEDLIKIGIRDRLVTPVTATRMTGQDHPLTPPSETIGTSGEKKCGAVKGGWINYNETLLPESAVAQCLEQYLAPTPPAAASSNENKRVPWEAPPASLGAPEPVTENAESHESEPIPGQNVAEIRDFDREFESLMNVDKMTEGRTLGDGGGLASLQGESSGFFMDIDWMNGGAFPNYDAGSPFDVDVPPVAEAVGLGDW